MQGPAEIWLRAADGFEATLEQVGTISGPLRPAVASGQYVISSITGAVAATSGQST